MLKSSLAPSQRTFLMARNTNPDRLRRALIHDLRGLLSPIFTVSQSRAIFGPADPEVVAEEDLMLFQASTQMRELLNSWDLAFSRSELDIPGPIEVLAVVSRAVSLVGDMIPEDSRPIIELPAELPSCMGHGLLFSQALADIFRFLAGLCSGHSRMIVTGSISGNQVIYEISIPGVRCSENEISDYLHDDREPGRQTYALVGARFMLERQGGRLEFTSSEENGVTVRVTMTCRTEGLDQGGEESFL